MANTTDKSILTAAGKALLAQLNAEEKPLIIDKMIFANVPNRPEFPQPDDVVPTDHVVHQEGVEQRGRLSADSVIYSTTLTSDVGPFEFNWTGAYCSEYGVLVTIDHHALTPKSADEPGVAGNTLVRSVVLEYKDIAEITNITVDASSWQYNATPRMKKMDDDVAQAIIDQNGKDWFIDDGFLVTPQVSAFNIKAGAGYVSGNRVTLEFDRNVQVPNKPSFIYVDAHREGTPTGEQVTLFDFVITEEDKDDYTDANGVKHFVCKIAQVLVDGSVFDLRLKGEKDTREKVAGKPWQKDNIVTSPHDVRVFNHHKWFAPRATVGAPVTMGESPIGDYRFRPLGREINLSELIAIDGEIDKTQEIMELIKELPDVTRFIADENIVFNPVLVSEVLGVRASIDCRGAKIGNNTSSYKQKFYGLITLDDTDNDSALSSISGHNAAFMLNNMRNAGTPSAKNALAGILWSSGFIRSGSYRNIALAQFRGDDNGRWRYNIRKLSPWSAVTDPDNQYEFWRQGEVVKVGDFRNSGPGRMYKSKSSGVCGPDAPSHFKGVISDGGVLWEYEGSSDATVFSFDELGRLSTNGDPNENEQISFKQSHDDHAPSYIMAQKASGENKDVIVRQFPTDESGMPIPCPYERYDKSGQRNVMSISGETLIRYEGERVEHRAFEVKSNTLDAIPAPSVDGFSSFVSSPDSPLEIENFIQSKTFDQELEIIAGNDNTTIKNNEFIILEGGVDLKMSTLSVIKLKKCKAISSRWFEVGRSIK